MLVYSFAGILTFFYIALSARIIYIRRTKKISLGDSGNSSLQTAIRVHGNFIEYTLLFLLLFYFCESKGMSDTRLLWMGSIFIIARILHVHGLFTTNFTTRTIGMLGTFAVLIREASYLLF